MPKAQQILTFRNGGVVRTTASEHASHHLGQADGPKRASGAPQQMSLPILARALVPGSNRQRSHINKADDHKNNQDTLVGGKRRDAQDRIRTCAYEEMRALI